MPCLEIQGGLRAKEKIRNHREQQTVHEQFRQGVKGAENNMVCHPGKEKPPRPVPAAEHEYSAKRRKQPNEANPDKIVWEGTRCFELGGMVCKSNDAGCNEYPTDDRD